MFKILRADKDTYVGNFVIDEVATTDANTGIAGSLNLYKLYGASMSGSTPITELSRLLVHFDLEPLRGMVYSGTVDTTHPSFECRLQLRDVYGGQPTPSGFNVAVYPLSATFNEGLGKDVVRYSDVDEASWLSGSRNTPWFTTGCASAGHPTVTCDYITGSMTLGSLKKRQAFVKGTEDLDIDVTTIVSATLAGLIPDNGFRISLDTTEENDTATYFVKRFASRQAYNETKHPQLVIKFDDSIIDDTQNLTVNVSGTMFLYNYVYGQLQNIMSGATNITGAGSATLKLVMEVSGGFHTLTFPVSQHTIGQTLVTGTYKSYVNIATTDVIVAAELAASGSLEFVPVWSSLDLTVGYHTGSTIVVRKQTASMLSLAAKKQYVVSVTGIMDEHRTTETLALRVNIFDKAAVSLTPVKRPIEAPCVVIRGHFAIRDVDANQYVVPVDLLKNTTRISSDAMGMFFSLDVSNLLPSRVYTVDVVLETNAEIQTYHNASRTFKVTG